jgi:hypothetical protein
LTAGIADIPDVTRVQVGDKVEAWRKLGHRYYATEHPLYPWDPAVVRAFRLEFDPTFTPLWVRNIYRRPNGMLLYYDRHAIGVYDPQLEGSGIELTYGELEWTSHKLRPNKVFDILWGGKNPISSDLPGQYQPLDWAQFHEKIHCKDWVAFILDELGDKTIEERVEIIARHRRDMKEKFYADLKAELDYRFDHDWDHSIEKTKQYFT